MPEPAGPSRSDPIAVIDIGSNSGRVVVFARDPASHLRLLAGSRAALRLVHDVDTRSQLTEATMMQSRRSNSDLVADRRSLSSSSLMVASFSM